MPQEGHTSHGDIATASQTLQANKTYMVMAKVSPVPADQRKAADRARPVRYHPAKE